MPAFASSLGPIFVGVVLSVTLYGVTVAQACFYAWHYSDDSLPLKAFVLFLCLLDTAGTALNVEFLWYYLIESRAHPEDATVVPPPYAAQHALESLAVLLVQCFYIHTIWSLMSAVATSAHIRRYRVPLSIAAVLLALISFAGGIGVVVETTSTTGAYKLVKELTVPGLIQPLAALVADAYITGALCWILGSAGTGLRGSGGLVGKLTTYAINRGVLTSTVQLLQFATYLSDIAESTFIVDIFSIPGSTLYVNSLLAVLNARRHLRTQLHLHSDVELAVSASASASGSGSGPALPDAPPPPDASGAGSATVIGSGFGSGAGAGTAVESSSLSLSMAGEGRVRTSMGRETRNARVVTGAAG